MCEQNLELFQNARVKGALFLIPEQRRIVLKQKKKEAFSSCGLVADSTKALKSLTLHWTPLLEAAAVTWMVEMQVNYHYLDFARLLQRALRTRNVQTTTLN